MVKFCSVKGSIKGSQFDYFFILHYNNSRTNLQGEISMNEEKKFEIEVLTRLTKIETMLEDFKGVESKSMEAYNLSKSNKQRLDKIEDNNKWLFRTTVGAVITGLIAIVLTFIK